MSDPAPDPGFTVPEPREQERMVEALLFSAVEPMSAEELERRLPRGCDAGEALRVLEARYAGRGVTLLRVAGKWAFRTASDLAFLLRDERQVTRKLSRAAIETLATIAYNQPVTRTEIEEVRGVAVSKGTLDTLLELGWIGLGRRRESPGRPVTFVTTEAFLDHFGLESLRDLPALEELKAAGLLETRPGTVPRAMPLQGDDDPDDGPDEEPDQGEML